MRGRTLNDSFIILDEAQNTTPEQMKMFLTRIGFNSKAVINGDVTQVDLPPGRGRRACARPRRCSRASRGSSSSTSTSATSCATPLVQKIVNAYEAFEQRRSDRESERAPVAARTAIGGRRQPGRD